MDAFVRAYDPAGNPRWTRLFGTKGEDRASAVSVDMGGNVFVAGHTSEALPGQTSSGNLDAFVRAYDLDGTVRWTRQFGTDGGEMPMAASVDGAGNVLVAGITSGTFPGQTREPGPWPWDVFVRKYDPAGNELWTRQFGTGNDDFGYGIGVDGSGNVFVAGTTGATLPGQVSGGWDDAFVRVYDAAGNERWTRQFGAGGGQRGTSLSVDADGNVFVAGYTAAGTFAGHPSAGDTDTFVRRYDATGTLLWTEQYGSSGADLAFGVSADGSGNVFIAGYTDGTLPGQVHLGLDDAFVARLIP